MAYRSPMTAMPQVVAVFNAFGGGASALAVGAALEEALKGEWIEEITVQFTSSASGAMTEAANVLDWQKSVIDPDEHMYGF